VRNRTERWSGADLRALVNEAGLQALIRIADLNEAVPAQKSLTGADFAEAMANIDDGSSD